MMELLGSLGGFIPKLGGGQSAVTASQVPFKSHVGITDGDVAYDTAAEVIAIIGALAAGSVWTLIWQMTVPAQQQIRWGFGSPTLPHNQGYMWFASINITVDFQVGVLRLVQANSRQTKVMTVMEADDTRLHAVDNTTLASATPTNINEMLALPEKVEFPKVGEDSLLQLHYRCITPATAEDAVGFSIPVTIYQ